MDVTFVPAGGSVADLGAFTARVARLDPGAAVRLRSVEGGVGAWAWLPYAVLVHRTAGGRLDGAVDVTVPAGELLARLAAWTGTGGRAGPAGVALPGGHDAAWRGPLPGGSFAVLDDVPADVVRRLVSAGRRAFHEVRDRPDARAAGESLLDSEVLSVTGTDLTVGLTLRLVNALHQMHFLGPEAVTVAATRAWTRVAATFGTAYARRTPTALAFLP